MTQIKRNPRNNLNLMTLGMAGWRSDTEVSVVELNLKLMWEIVQKTKVGNGGVAYVVDAGGRLIAHPDFGVGKSLRDLSTLAQVREARTTTALTGEAHIARDMRFVPIKTFEQQGCLVLHRTRHLLVRQQTATINSIRAHLAEFGIVAPVGRRGVEHLLEVVADANDTQVPEVARACVAALGVQLQQLKAQILEFDRRILAWHRSSEASRRLNHIPGVGPLLATALVASIGDPKAFRSGRDFSAWIGLVPKQNSSGGKDKLGNISKRGDRYLRSLFTAGALAVIRYAKIHAR